MEQAAKPNVPKILALPPDVALVREARHHLIERDVLVSLNQGQSQSGPR